MQRSEHTELERQKEQAKLDATRRSLDRNRNGQFSTPPALADEIVQYCRQLWAANPRPVRFLEPCIGTGAFFSSLRRSFPTSLIEAACGYELDHEHLKVARQLWADAGLQVKEGDFLSQPLPARKFNLLITNPPYVRHHHLKPGHKMQLQALVRERLHLRMSGLAGLYCYFLLLSDAWLEPSALSIWLIPSEFMDVNYGAVVKQYLAQRVRLLRIHRFCPDDVQFADALVSSAIVIFEKAPPCNQQVTFSYGGSLTAPTEQGIWRQDDLQRFHKWTHYLGGPKASSHTHRPAALFGDLFTIKRGLATGNNSFFILPRHKAVQLGIPSQVVRPILPSPRHIETSIIESDAEGYPLDIKQLALIDCRLPEHEVAERYPDFWRYLRSGKLKGADRTYLTSRRMPWYSQEDRPAPPFLCTYMGRSSHGRKPFRFLWNKSQATAHNVYLLLYPKGPLQTALGSDPSIQEVLFRALQSLDTDLIRRDGRVYGGGLFKMEPKELAAVPADFLTESLGISLCKHEGQLDLFS